MPFIMEDQKNEKVKDLKYNRKYFQKTQNMLLNCNKIFKIQKDLDHKNSHSLTRYDIYQMPSYDISCFSVEAKLYLKKFPLCAK